LEAARPAFDGFLAKYPYCYGYWKKYADMEKKYNNIKEAEQVLLAVTTAHLDVQFWLTENEFLHSLHFYVYELVSS
jgi:pre-mRNA-processing factor 39